MRKLLSSKYSNETSTICGPSSASCPKEVSQVVLLKRWARKAVKKVGETLDGYNSRVGQAGALMWAIKQGAESLVFYRERQPILLYLQRGQKALVGPGRVAALRRKSQNKPLVERAISLMTFGTYLNVQYHKGRETQLESIYYASYPVGARLAFLPRVRSLVGARSKRKESHLVTSFYSYDEHFIK